MTNKQIIFIATLAFALGFYASEYRHAKRAANPDEQLQVIAKTDNAEPDFFDNTASPSPSEIRTTPPVSTNEFLPTKAQSPLERANQFIANGAYADAARLLQQLLKQEPNNSEALWLLARVYEQLGQHKESVGIWFRYISTEVDAQKIENALVYLATYLLRLTDNPSIFGEGYQWLMAQINDLIKLTPNNGELHLQLAKMHLKIADKEQAQYHALMAANQSETRVRAEKILANLDEGSLAQDDASAEITVPLIRFGEQFLVPVTIEGEKVKLLLDTGASISGLTASFINRHYSFVKSPKPIQLNTASGTVESYLFVVDTFTLANITFNKHMLARLPMDNADQFDGLLGVDILGRFDFVIDQNKALLRLKKR
jgi:predicted aspartyl protease